MIGGSGSGRENQWLQIFRGYAALHALLEIFYKAFAAMPLAYKKRGFIQSIDYSD